jgi:hypothetical protein
MVYDISHKLCQESKINYQFIESNEYNSYIIKIYSQNKVIIFAI